MIARPRSVTLVGIVFVAFGCIALPLSLLRVLDAAGPGGLAELLAARPVELGLAAAARVLAIVGGAFLLRGLNWARWLIVGWLAYHVALSLLHAPFEVVAHSLLLLVVAYALFRPEATAYFRGSRGEARS